MAWWTDIPASADPWGLLEALAATSLDPDSRLWVESMLRTPLPRPVLTAKQAATVTWLASRAGLAPYPPRADGAR